MYLVKFINNNFYGMFVIEDVDKDIFYNKLETIEYPFMNNIININNKEEILSKMEWIYINEDEYNILLKYFGPKWGINPIDFFF